MKERHFLGICGLLSIIIANLNTDKFLIIGWHGAGIFFVILGLFYYFNGDK